jgi:hypothetical protein
MSIEFGPLLLRNAQEGISRLLPARGWRSIFVVGMSLFLVFTFMMTLFNSRSGRANASGDLVRVVHNDQAPLPRPPIQEVLSLAAVGLTSRVADHLRPSRRC